MADLAAEAIDSLPPVGNTDEGEAVAGAAQKRSHVTTALTEDGRMKIEIHAPTTLLLVVSLVLIVIAVICVFVVPNTAAAFWMALAAYGVLVLGTIVKT